MKKILSLVLAVVFCLSLSLVSFASATEDENFTVTTTDTLLPMENKKESTFTLTSPVNPYDIEFTHLDGTPMVIKYYQLDPDLDTEALFPESETIDSATYGIYDILEKSQPPITKVKTVTMPISLSSDSDKKNDIVSELPPTMEYNEGGFTGTLTLNTQSLTTEAAGTTLYSYPTRTTKEFTGLDRADVSYIPKTLDGMALIDVSWASLGNSQRGDTMVPAHYTATALYGGTSTGSRATGYESRAYYEGEVSKQTPSQSFYKVIYLKENVQPSFVDIMVMLIGSPLIGIIIGLLIVVLVNPIKRKKG